MKQNEVENQLKKNTINTKIRQQAHFDFTDSTGMATIAE